MRGTAECINQLVHLIDSIVYSLTSLWTKSDQLLLSM